MKRKWFSPLDLAVLLSVLAVSLGGLLLLFRQERAQSASVYLADDCLLTVVLADVEEPFSYTVETAGGSVTLLFASDGVSATASDCPDGTCRRTGKITRSGESIVCAPLGVTVLLSGEGELDGVTG